MRPAIDYSDWVSIAFEEAKRQGFEPSASFETGNPNAEVVSVAASIWNDRKDEMTSESAARRIAKQEINVA